MNDTAAGRRFSLQYLERGSPGSDSARFRHRLGAFVSAHESNWGQGLHGDFSQELGIPVTWGPYGVDWRSTFASIEVHDLLDILPFAFLRASSRNPAGGVNFRSFVERALREENLQYTVDGECGVHPFVDTAFQEARLSVLSSLGAPNFRAAMDAFQKGMDGLVANDTLTAVRGVFDAAESLFKQEFSTSKLGKTEIEKNLTPRAKAFYPDRAGDAAGRLCASFCEWVNGAHQYRHAAGTPDPAPPPRDLAVAFIATGTGWIRWLVATDFLRPTRDE